MFRIIKKSRDGSARRAELSTPHGFVQTPAFMPVGTLGAVKALTPLQVRECGVQMVLANAYHLELRPGSEFVAKTGGIHAFSGWYGPVLTDSGGFQAFSLAKLCRASEDGLAFNSHIDGSARFMSPESCMAVQNNLGSDVCMVLDECIPHPCPRAECENSTKRSVRWAKRCFDEFKKLGMPEKGRALFAIVQGGGYEDLRGGCARALAQLDFPGYAVGGVSVGESEGEMLEQVGWAAQNLPFDKPRYVMGLGTPPQILKMAALGADLFDCVMPTRLARHGTAFTADGEINIKNARFARDETCLDESVQSYASGFSKAYIRHLFKAGEPLALTLLSIHNVSFFQKLMGDARKHIEDGDFERWCASWISRYEAGGTENGGDCGNTGREDP